VHLHAAFVPPRAVAEALAQLLVSLEPTPEPPAPPTRRGLFGRRTAEREGSPTARTGPLLDAVPPDKMLLPITDFGYLASGDARRLVDAVAQACAALPVGPTLHISGGSALVDPEDRSVWADLAGTEKDLDAMRGAARAVVSAVEPLGFFCDRRQFRPRLAVATITDDTTVEHLEQVLHALAAYSSESWNVTEVAVLQRGSGVWRTVPIGPGG